MHPPDPQSPWNWKTSPTGQPPTTCAWMLTNLKKSSSIRDQEVMTPLNLFLEWNISRPWSYLESLCAMILSLIDDVYISTAWKSSSRVPTLSTPFVSWGRIPWDVRCRPPRSRWGHHHGSAIASIVSFRGLLGWGISHLGNLMPRPWL